MQYANSLEYHADPNDIWQITINILDYTNRNYIQH